MARRRTKDAARTPTGRLSRAFKGACRDHGTAEGRAKKHWLVNGADPALAATATGILLARDLIDKQQHAAANRYAALHRVVFGDPHRQLCNLGREPGAGLSLKDDALIRSRRALDDMHAKLTPAERQAVATVACFGMIPTWFFAERLRLRVLPEDRRDREALIGGLDALVGRRRER